MREINCRKCTNNIGWIEKKKREEYTVHEQNVRNTCKMLFYTFFFVEFAARLESMFRMFSWCFFGHLILLCIWQRNKRNKLHIHSQWINWYTYLLCARFIRISLASPHAIANKTIVSFDSFILSSLFKLFYNLRPLLFGSVLESEPKKKLTTT